MKTIYSLNDKVIIYPNEKGWQKIKDVYSLDLSYAPNLLTIRTVEDGGYEDMLWRIIHDLGGMFYHGSHYFKTTEIKMPTKKQ